MAADKTTRRTTKTSENLDDNPSADEPSSLLAQAKGFQQVAQDAWDECEKGAEAEKEVTARKNVSGQ